MKLIISIFFKNLYYFLSNENYRTFSRLALFNKVSKRHKERTIKFNGLKFKVPDMMSFIWQYYDIFFEQIFKFNADRKELVILDCGANVGLASAFLKESFPNAIIEAFEPDPSIYKYCEENLRKNFGDAITINKEAVWIEDTILKFSSEGADAGSLITEEDNNSKIIEVKAIDFKKKLQGFEKIDFLKMDIEGAENEVVPYIKSELHRVENMFLEFHSYKSKPQNLGLILDILTEAGFRYYLDNVLKTKTPFLQKKSKNSMDIQMNIFAYRP